MRRAPASRRRRGPLALAACVLVGCASALARPDTRDAGWAAARWPGTTLGDLEHGRALYVEHCGSCHQLHRPEEFSPERWPGLVARMGSEAELSPADADLVAHFLAAASARVRGPGGT